MTIRLFRAAGAITLGLALCATASAQDRKVLNLAFTSAETTIDPAKISDLYSRAITAHILDANLRARKSVQNKSLEGAGIHN